MTHDERMHQLLYSNDGRVEQCERICKLEALVMDMHDHIKESCDVCDELYCSSWDEDNECCVYDSYMRELGIPDE